MLIKQPVWDLEFVLGVDDVWVNDAAQITKDSQSSSTL